METPITSPSPSAAFLLIVRDAPAEIYDAMSAEQRRHSMDAWNAWVDSLAARGTLVAGNPLESGGRVVAGARGRKVMDGPYTEAKELVGGFFLIGNVDMDGATALVQECPSLQYGMSIEIRPIAGACHVAQSLGWTTMRG